MARLRCSYDGSIPKMRGPAYIAFLENKIEHLEGRLLASYGYKGPTNEEKRGETTSCLPSSDRSSNELEIDVKEDPMAVIASSSGAVGEAITSFNGGHDHMPTSETVSEAGLDSGTHDPCISRELTNDVLLDDMSDNIPCSPVHPDDSVSLAGTMQTAQHSPPTNFPAPDECFDRMISDSWAWPGENGIAPNMLLQNTVADHLFNSSLWNFNVGLPS